jgi:hypothetical protein
MQLRLKLTDSCLYFLYTDVKWCVLLYIITLYCINWVFLEVKIAVFLFILAFVYLGCSEGILHLNYWSSSSGFFFYYYYYSFLFVLMNMLSRCRKASTGRGGVWCIRRCTIYGVLHRSHL